jgi:hypothetical protein
MATTNENSDKHVVKVHAKARNERREVINFPHIALGAIVDLLSKSRSVKLRKYYHNTFMDIVEYNNDGTNLDMTQGYCSMP